MAYRSAFCCIAGLIVIAPTPVRAQQQDPFSLCRQVKDDAVRLKCFDAAVLLRDALGDKLDKVPEGTADWSVKEETSPLDDSLSIAAMLRTTQGDGALLIRCREKKVEAYVMPKTLNMGAGGSGLRVAYRIGQGAVVTARWLPSMDGRAAFVPSPIPLVLALADNAKFFVRIWDRQNVPHDAMFSVADVTKVRSKLSEACELKVPARQPPPPRTAPQPEQQGAAQQPPGVTR
jgi:hypothetical protein